MASCKFVVLTSGGLYGRDVTRLLAHWGVPFDLVTVAYPPPRRLARSWGRWMAQRMRTHLAGLGWLRRWRQRKLPPFPVRETYCKMTNSPALLRHLRRLAPDYVLMAGGGILSDATIQTARLGVLNVHPGWLPEIRGRDALRNALLRGVPLAVTAHFIDPGIDTGDIVCRQLLPVDPGDAFGDLASRCHDLSCAVMADLACRLHVGETLPRSAQQQRHPLCRTLSPADAAAAERNLANGRALSLYQQWRTRSATVGDGADLLSRYYGGDLKLLDASRRKHINRGTAAA